MPHVRDFRRELHPAIHSGPEFVEAIFGAETLELAGTADDPQQEILNILHEPKRYAPIVRGSRGLAEKHSYSARFRELIEIVTS